MRPILARSHVDLLERPLVAHLATIRPNGGPQSTVVRFEWDGRTVRIAVPRSASMLANLEREPRASLSIADPDVPLRWLEVRGVVEAAQDEAEPGAPDTAPSSAGEGLVMLALRPTTFLALEDGVVVTAR